jgi:hypothetical protein
MSLGTIGRRGGWNLDAVAIGTVIYSTDTQTRSKLRELMYGGAPVEAGV